MLSSVLLHFRTQRCSRILHFKFQDPISASLVISDALKMVPETSYAQAGVQPRNNHSLDASQSGETENSVSISRPKIHQTDFISKLQIRNLKRNENFMDLIDMSAREVKEY